MIAGSRGCRKRSDKLMYSMLMRSWQQKQTSLLQNQMEVFATEFYTYRKCRVWCRTSERWVESLKRWRSRWRSTVTTSRHNKKVLNDRWLTSASVSRELLKWSPTEIGTKKSSVQSHSRFISILFKAYYFNPVQGLFQSLLKFVSISSAHFCLCLLRYMQVNFA